MISEDRQTHLAHVIVDGIWKDDLVDFTADDIAMRSANKAVAAFAKALRDVDKKAEERVLSLKRGIPEGSPEWDVLYNKYFEEEMSRRVY